MEKRPLETSTRVQLSSVSRLSLMSTDLSD